MEPNNKKLESFIEKWMANDTLEKPSVDFTNSVLQNIKAESKPIVYRSLISKRAWFIIALISCGLAGYMYLKDPVLNYEILDKINLSNLIKNPLENINFNFSKTFVYAIAFLAFMLCVQIPILKNYFNKRMHF